MTDNTLFTAQNIGNLTSTRFFSNFVGNSDTVDYYRFNFSSGNINVALTGLSADADIRLIRDTNNNGVVDSGEVVAFSTLGGAANDTINLRSPSSGVYYLEVARFSSNNTNYSLRLSNSVPSNLIAEESNLGNLSANATTQTGFVGNADTSDMYRFSLSAVSDINIALTGLSSDADVRLIRDANNNGVVDAAEVVASASLGGTSNDTINLNNQAAGTYFVQAYQFSGDTNYTLRLSNNSVSNLIAEESNLGNLSANATTQTGFVGNADTSDMYRFSLSAVSDINIALTGLSSDADVRLIRDANNNGVVDAAEVVASASLGGTSNDTINLNNQAAGTYFVQAYQFSGDTNYTLRLSNNSVSNLIAEESNLGNLSANATTQTGFVGNADTSDMYRFSLSAVSDINIALTGLSSDADVRLIRDANNNGVVDAAEVVASASLGGTSNDTINLNNQAAGTYFVQAYQFSGDTNYTLRLSNNSVSNLLAQEENFGTLGVGSSIIRNNFVGNSDTSDIYAFSFSGTGTFSARLGGLSNDADLRLIRDGNNNGVIDGTDVIASSTAGGTTTDVINTTLSTGRYFLQAYQFSGDTSYNLNVDVF